MHHEENYVVRKASLEDIELLQKLGRQTFHETFRDSNTPENLNKYLEENFNFRQLTKELNKQGSEFFIAWQGDAPVGYLKINTGEAQLEFKKADEMEIERIYVLKAFWGKFAGQHLLDFALSLGRKQNLHKVWLGVWEENFRALRFYEKNGFLPFSSHDFIVGDDVQTDILMQLTLK